MLIDVSGGPSLTLEEANKLVDLIGQKLPEDINIIWGAHIFPDLKNTVKVLAIITGVTSKQISGKSIAEDQQLKEKREVEDELGITFLS
jgi:cell division protein FtsZ